MLYKQLQACGKFKFCFWNFLEFFFFFNIFDPQLVESTNAEPKEMVGRLYSAFPVGHKAPCAPFQSNLIPFRSL